MAIAANSPVTFQFARQGGADIQCQVQVWHKKDKYSPADRPIKLINFTNPLVVHEAESLQLPKGPYVCVLIGIAREALNGIYNAQLDIEGVKAFQKNGDANSSSKPNDIVNLRADIEMVVS
ncbi:hypothetical protein ACQ86G_12535 [Roseateles chitinivorans]|uniref:hypothetical protein n=1 Tax=Roseateles chitinivorans TaxID=2917965 RepID=UPI003D66DC3F